MEKRTYWLSQVVESHHFETAWLKQRRDKSEESSKTIHSVLEQWNSSKHALKTKSWPKDFVIAKSLTTKCHPRTGVLCIKNKAKSLLSVGVISLCWVCTIVSSVIPSFLYKSELTMCDGQHEDHAQNLIKFIPKDVLTSIRTCPLTTGVCVCKSTIYLKHSGYRKQTTCTFQKFLVITCRCDSIQTVHNSNVSPKILCCTVAYKAYRKSGGSEGSRLPVHLSTKEESYITCSVVKGIVRNMRYFTAVNCVSHRGCSTS